MGILQSTSKGVLKEPPITIIYGAGGLGKDTFAAGFPAPIVIDVEKGTGRLNVERLTPSAYDEVLDFVKAIRDDKHEFKTLNLSGLDALEAMLFQKIIKEDTKGAKNIVQAAGGYGNGYKVAIEFWSTLQGLLQEVRSRRNMYVNIICHELVYPYNDPMAASYDRFRLKLYEGSKDSAAKLWYDFADIVLFAKRKVYQSTENRAMDDGKHYIYTQSRAAFDAKSRYPLPFEMELDTAKFLSALEKGPRTAVELEKEVTTLAAGIKDAVLKEKVLAKIKSVSGNANELSVVEENVKIILSKE